MRHDYPHAETQRAQSSRRELSSRWLVRLLQIYLFFLSRRNRRNGRNLILSLILMSIDNHAAWLGEAPFCYFRYFCGTIIHYLRDIKTISVGGELTP